MYSLSANDQGPCFSTAKNEEFHGKVWGIPQHSPGGPKINEIIIIWTWIMKVKLMCRIKKKRQGLYCMCIVVNREKLLTNAGMFVYINTCFEFSM